MRIAWVLAVGMTAATTACAGPGAPGELPRQVAPADTVANGHFKHSVSYKLPSGEESLDVLLGPLQGSNVAPRSVRVAAGNNDVRAAFDRGYAFLVTSAEAHKPPPAAELHVMIPIYPKVLRSTAIEISTPGSKLVVQVLDTWESAQIGDVCQRAFLRNEDGDNNTHRASVRRLDAAGNPTGTPVMLIEDASTTQPDADEGQYVELIKVNGGYELSEAKNIKGAPADIANFLNWADTNARNSGMTP